MNDKIPQPSDPFSGHGRVSRLKARRFSSSTSSITSAAANVSVFCIHFLPDAAKTPIIPPDKVHSVAVGIIRRASDGKIVDRPGNIMTLEQLRHFFPLQPELMIIGDVLQSTSSTVSKMAAARLGSLRCGLQDIHYSSQFTRVFLRKHLFARNCVRDGEYSAGIGRSLASAFAVQTCNLYYSRIFLLILRLDHDILI